MRRLSGFGCEVRYTRPSGPDASTSGHMELDDLVGWAEILSLHLPLTDATRNLIGRTGWGACRRAPAS